MKCPACDGTGRVKEAPVSPVVMAGQLSAGERFRMCRDPKRLRIVKKRVDIHVHLIDGGFIHHSCHVIKEP